MLLNSRLAPAALYASIDHAEACNFLEKRVVHDCTQQEKRYHLTEIACSHNHVRRRKADILQGLGHLQFGLRLIEARKSKDVVVGFCDEGPGVEVGDGLDGTDDSSGVSRQLHVQESHVTEDLEGQKSAHNFLERCSPVVLEHKQDNCHDFHGGIYTGCARSHECSQ